MFCTFYTVACATAIFKDFVTEVDLKNTILVPSSDPPLAMDALKELAWRKRHASRCQTL